MSMGEAIPRYIAMSRNKIEQDQYFLSGIILGIMPSILILFIGILFVTQFVSVIFRDLQYQSLFVATLWLLVGNSVFNTLFAFYRGTNLMQRSNLWQLAVSAIGPLFIAWAFAHYQRADLIVTFLAMLMWLTIFPLSYHGIKALKSYNNRFSQRQTLEKLAYYALPRVPGGFALATLFSVGPFLAPYFGSLRDAGYLVAAQSILLILNTGLTAFGLVALPKLAQMNAGGRQDLVTKIIEDLIGLVLHTGLFATLQALLWTDVVVLILLGEQYQEATLLMRIILVTVMPYQAYIMLRSIIDAVEEKAINTVNLFIALIVTVIVSSLLAIMGMGTTGLAVGITLGFVVLGVCTIYYLSRCYTIRWKQFCFPMVLSINGIFFVFGFFIKSFFVNVFIFNELLFISGVITMVFAMAITYIVILWWLKINWITDFMHRLVVFKLGSDILDN